MLNALLMSLVGNNAFNGLLIHIRQGLKWKIATHAFCLSIIFENHSMRWLVRIGGCRRMQIIEHVNPPHTITFAASELPTLARDTYPSVYFASGHQNIAARCCILIGYSEVNYTQPIIPTTMCVFLIFWLSLPRFLFITPLMNIYW